ncbi:MAG: hypothetical protein JWQ14_307, partial [Adhaeribacter sp.]|nr:hypothetical protein [Adhaeribacter sp.]
MIRLKNIDYTKYAPVRLRGNGSYFIYTVDKHEFFDEAADKYPYFCHPLTQYGEADFKKTVILPKSA